MAGKGSRDWHTGLLDCAKDVPSCCYGFWCCPCLACSISVKLEENTCLPLCDIFGPGVFAACGIPLCAPPAVLSARVAMRHRYGIKGSLCKDIAVSCVCEWCSWCQMHRELKHHKKTPTVINVQNNPVVNMQPIPVAQPPVVMMPAQPVPASYVVQPGVVMRPY
ncbi:cornifelin-like [Archocentrus centrarchus]|uniref:cornifelin-like n=1 Tax=Archocentrus centrarchus TaxID=63155 RepID=UPI0011E9C45D|nr:cornifelin-like [Archocentrus centrarchus]